jgi:hypothetical protein
MKARPTPAALLALVLPVFLALAAPLPALTPQAASQSAAPSGDQLPARQRLILTDGSWQVVTKYEVHGDRVRFFSAERDDWEEIPYKLIDWDATKKWNLQHQPGAPPPSTSAPMARPQPDNQAGQSGSSADTGLNDAAKIDSEAAAERADLKARTPLVAPNLHLPDQDGIFVLDTFQSIPELIHLDQTTGNVNRSAAHNVLRAAIDSFHGAQEPIRINGQAAPVRTHVEDPVLYVSLDSTTDAIEPESAMMVDTHGASSAQDKNQYSSPDSRYAIVRVDVRPGERVIGAVRISRLGKTTQSEDIVPTTAEILPGKHWMKLTPKEPLPVGEYALMEILAPGVVNLDVWDFGVSPNSPENRHPITPVQDGNP